MKRFTDTDIWDKEWFMTLKPKLKCLVIFIRDKCDAVGIWTPNWLLAQTYIGEKVTEQELLSIDDGRQFRKLKDKIICVGFVNFQYGILTADCRPHRKILALIDKYELQNERVLLGYQYPINRVKEQDKEKEEDKEKEKDGGGGEKKPPPENSIFQGEKNVFKKFYEIYPGGKGTLETEYEFLIACHPTEFRSILIKILPALQKEIEYKNRKRSLTGFAEEFPKLENWVKKRQWEFNYPEITVTQPKDYRDRAADNRSKVVQEYLKSKQNG